MHEVKTAPLYAWLKRQAAWWREDEANAPNPLDRYKARGRREAYEDVIKHLDYVRGAR
jgi:hypothetical protein